MSLQLVSPPAAPARDTAAAPAKRLVNLSQFARRVGVSARTLKRWVEAGDAPAATGYPGLWWTEAAVERYVREREAQPRRFFRSATR